MLLLVYNNLEQTEQTLLTWRGLAGLKTRLDRKDRVEEEVCSVGSNRPVSPTHVGV